MIGSILKFGCFLFLFSPVFGQGNMKNIQQKSANEITFWNTYQIGVSYQNSNFKKADSLRIVIYDRAQKIGDSAKLFALFYDIEMDKLQGKLARYAEKVGRIDVELSKSHGPEVMVYMLQCKANVALDNLKYDDANTYLIRAKKLGFRKCNEITNSETSRLLALTAMRKNNKEDALNYIDEAITLARQTSKRKQAAICFNTHGEILTYFGQSEVGVAKSLIGYQIAITDNYPRLVAIFSNQLGKSQLSIGNYKQADLFFEKSIALSTQVRDYLTVANARLSAGQCFDAQGNLNLANKNIQLAMTIFKSEASWIGLGQSCSALGKCQRKQGKNSEAKQNLEKSIAYFEKCERLDLLDESYLELGLLAIQNGNSIEALSFLKTALNLAYQYKKREIIGPIYKAQSVAYSKQGNFPFAYSSLKQYSNFVDSSKRLIELTKLAELSELYQSEQRNKIINEQRESIEKQTKEREITKVAIENINLRNNLMIYLIIGLLIIGALVFYLSKNRINQTKLKQQQRDSEMNQTLLRTQMNPHFVFNAMSVIQSYIYDNDVKNSTKFLVNFSKLMRLILENSSKEFIPIETEMEILQKYLETQKLRFEDRFEFTVDAEDVLFDDEAQIPPMITQPFIENAIEHGQLHTVENGFIHISFKKIESFLHIEITDNGIGRKGSKSNKKSSDHKSMAMNITNERIENLNQKYKTDGNLIMEDFDKQKETGTLVHINLPYQTSFTDKKTKTS